MPIVDPILILELRSMFFEGATPSALIRCLAERHDGEPQLDSLVRAYFREAFHIPMLRIGSDQLQRIAEGDSLAALNIHVLPQMVESMAEWNLDAEADGSWIDAISPERSPSPDPVALPEFAGSWGAMDAEAKRFVRRLLDNSQAMHRKLNILSALAERLQQGKPESGLLAAA